MESQSEESHLKTMRLLQAVFAFDDNDLVANRYGQITPAQKYQLRDYYLKNQNTLMGLAVITIIGVLLAMSSSPLMMVGILLGVGVLDILLIADMLHKRSDRALDLLDDRVLRVSGTAVLSQNTNSPNPILLFFAPFWYFISSLNSGTSYKLRIGGQKFNITSETFHALENGATYCVYYAPKKTPILSIEPLNITDQSPVYIPNARPQPSYTDYPPQKKKLG